MDKYKEIIDIFHQISVKIDDLSEKNFSDKKEIKDDIRKIESLVNQLQKDIYGNNIHHENFNKWIKKHEEEKDLLVEEIKKIKESIFEIRNKFTELDVRSGVIGSLTAVLTTIVAFLTRGKT